MNTPSKLSERFAGTLNEGQRTTIRRVLITLVVLACIGGLVFAASRTKTGEPDPAQSGDPLVVELFFPAPGSEVLRQAQIGVDLTAPYTGTLIVNGTEIPESQLTVRPELNQIFFQPGNGQVIEELLPGENCVNAIIWRVGSDRSQGTRSFPWCFEAT